jgi:hypothetical protein
MSKVQSGHKCRYSVTTVQSWLIHDGATKFITSSMTDKSSLCQCIAVCNPKYHVVEKTLGSSINEL